MDSYSLKVKNEKLFCISQFLILHGGNILISGDTLVQCGNKLLHIECLNWFNFGYAEYCVHATRGFSWSASSIVYDYFASSAGVLQTEARSTQWPNSEHL